VTVSKSWVAATNASSLAFGPLPRAYNPAWAIDLTGPYVQDFEAFTFDPSTSTVYYSGVPEGMNGATPRRVDIGLRRADARFAQSRLMR
jgi:hypothetical protein